MTITKTEVERAIAKAEPQLFTSGGPVDSSRCVMMPVGALFTLVEAARCASYKVDRFTGGGSNTGKVLCRPEEIDVSRKQLREILEKLETAKDWVEELLED